MSDPSEQKHVLDLLPAYAIGSLDAGETSRVEQHLISCLVCRDESNAFGVVAEQMSLAAPAAVPSAALKGRLMQRARSTRPQERVPAQMSSRAWFERLLPVWGAAAVLLIIALSGVGLILWQRLDQPEFVTSGGMRAIPLNSPNTASRATDFVLISADGEDGALVVDGLAPLGDAQQYQLWLIRDGQRASGAVFSTDERSYGGTRIRAEGSLLEYSAFGVTIEPTGGSPQPTGTQVLAGQFITP
jgi:anti-sigma-K factor RskA